MSFITRQALRAGVAELRGMAASVEADLRSVQEVGGSRTSSAPGELEELRDMAQAEAEELLAQVCGHIMVEHAAGTLLGCLRRSMLVWLRRLNLKL